MFQNTLKYPLLFPSPMYLKCMLTYTNSAIKVVVETLLILWAYTGYVLIRACCYKPGLNQSPGPTGQFHSFPPNPCWASCVAERTAVVRAPWGRWEDRGRTHTLCGGHSTALSQRAAWASSFSITRELIRHANTPVPDLLNQKQQSSLPGSPGDSVLG